MPEVYLASLEVFHLECGLVYLRSLALFLVTLFILRVLFLPAILRGSIRLRACSDLYLSFISPSRGGTAGSERRLAGSSSVSSTPSRPGSYLSLPIRAGRSSSASFSARCRFASCFSPLTSSLTIAPTRLSCLALLRSAAAACCSASMSRARLSRFRLASLPARGRGEGGEVRAAW